MDWPFSQDGQRLTFLDLEIGDCHLDVLDMKIIRNTCGTKFHESIIEAYVRANVTSQNISKVFTPDMWYP